MAYFSRRNQHIVEFSGYEEASSALRKRLMTVLVKYVDRNGINYGDDDPWYVETDEFLHEVNIEFPGKNPFVLIETGQFHEVFTVVEIFLDLAVGIYFTRRQEAPVEILQAFRLSGSVYTIKSRRIELVVDEKLARRLENAKAALSKNSSAYEKYFDAVGNLVGRKSKHEDVVKDIFIAFEDFLKSITDTKSYGGALLALEKKQVVSPTQKALLEKIYAYRSDTYGVGHAGNNKKPEEIDALWFADTVAAQILLIDRKFKQHEQS